MTGSTDDSKAPPHDPLRPLYTRARNHLAKRDTLGMVAQCVDALHEVHTGGREVLRKYQPWHLLLALKWTLQQWDALAHRRRPSTRNDLHAILNALHDAEGGVRLPSHYEHVSLFMRQIAFQQFALQKKHDRDALARQELLFATLPCDHPFSRDFLRLTGLGIEDYTALGFGLASLMLQTPSARTVRARDFAILKRHLPVGSPARFLQHLGRTVPEMHAWLDDARFRELSINDQRLLPSPFLERPLNEIDGAFFPLFPPLVLRTLETVVYRTLRREDPAAFGAEFGPIFERHLARCMESAGIAFLDEARLQTALTGAGKCVDFHLTDDDCTILIDAKGVEMSALGRVAHRAETILRALKQSAIKAIHQGQATARRLHDARAAGRLPATNGATFLLVVTYDDLFLGPGADFERTFGAHLLPGLTREFGPDLPVPLANVFFLSCDEFERLLGSVLAGATTLTGALRFAQTQEADAHTKKFNFGQHLDVLCPADHPLPYIRDGLDRLTTRVLRDLVA